MLARPRIASERTEFNPDNAPISLDTACEVCLWRDGRGATGGEAPNSGYDDPGYKQYAVTNSRQGNLYY